MKGVSFNKRTKKWYVRLTWNREFRYIGTYETLEDAEAAVIEFKKTHPGRGRPDKTSKVTVELVRERMDYNPPTGILSWKNGVDHGTFQIKPGKPIGSLFSDGFNEYLQVHINYKRFLVHRIIWLHYYGEWPEGEIDHINGIGTDNRICNLRVVTRTENSKNRKTAITNTSGVTGVYFHKTEKRWIASTGKGRRKSFRTKEEAIACRKQYEQEHGYHPNHGRKQ